MAHKCNFGEGGWCEDCDCTVTCPVCQHKGFNTVGKCKDDSANADKIWCPKCDYWTYIHIRTGGCHKPETEDKNLEESMATWNDSERGDDGIIRMKKSKPHLHVVEPK